MKKHASKLREIAILLLLMLPGGRELVAYDFMTKIVDEKIKNSRVLYRYSHVTSVAPISIHILDIDTKYWEVRLVSSMKGPVEGETVLQMAKRLKAFAAINGGFFYMQGKLPGLARGALKVSGKWLGFSSMPSGAVGWNKYGDFIFGRLQVRWFIQYEQDFIPLDLLNSSSNTNQIALFNQPRALAVAKFGPGKFIVLNPKFEVIKVRNVKPKSVNPKNFILYIGKKSALSDRIIVNGNRLIPYHGFVERSSFGERPITSQSWESADNILGAGNILIENGVPVGNFSLELQAAKENIAPRTLYAIDFSRSKSKVFYDIKNEPRVIGHYAIKEPPTYTLRHPRTVLATRDVPNTVISFIVVEGRDPQKSIGMTGRELSGFLRGINCQHAMNLDGGFSSAFYFDKSIRAGQKEKNSDGTMDWRKVANTLMIFPRVTDN